MESCKCPITNETFEDPVMGDDGHTYERKAITQWLIKNGTSPMTRQSMHINSLKTNFVVKNMIQELTSVSKTQQAQQQFMLDVDIRKTRQKPIFQGFGKTIYEVEWINRDGPPIILLKIGGAKANREASFYVQLSCHPYIIRTFGLVQGSTDSVMLLQEYAPHGDLSKLLRENRFKPNEKVLWRIFEQICDAMVCLTDNGIVHGDLACRNVLIFQHNSTDPDKNLVKLTDFSLTRGSKLYSVVETPAVSTMSVIPMRYAAPEIVHDTNRLAYSEKSDVYSMGVLMWEACSCGELPYSSLQNDNDVRQRKLDDKRLPKPPSCSDQLWTIINECWHLDPNNRMDFRAIKEHLLKLEYNSVLRSEEELKEKMSSTSTSTVMRSDTTNTSKFDNSHRSSQIMQTELQSQTSNNPSVSSEFVLSNHHIKEYICDCGTKCSNQTDLEQHRSNNCKIQWILCSFCQEPQSSTETLRHHLISCGNQTDECPNCRKYIRRAVFAYHYENNCANLDEPTPRSNSNRPTLRDDEVNNHDQTDDNDYKSQHRQKLSDEKSSPDTIQCKFCNNPCATVDLKIHQENCLKNPANPNKQLQRLSSTLDTTTVRPPVNEHRPSQNIVRIPCEYCNEPIDIPSWAFHTQDCRERKDRAEAPGIIKIERETTDKYSQDSSTSAKADRDPTTPSIYPSLPSSSMSASILTTQFKDIVHQINDKKRSSMLENRPITKSRIIESPSTPPSHSQSTFKDLGNDMKGTNSLSAAKSIPSYSTRDEDTIQQPTPSRHDRSTTSTNKSRCLVS